MLEPKWLWMCIHTNPETFGEPSGSSRESLIARAAVGGPSVRRMITRVITRVRQRLVHSLCREAAPTPQRSRALWPGREASTPGRGGYASLPNLSFPTRVRVCYIEYVCIYMFFFGLLGAESEDPGGQPAHKMIQARGFCEHRTYGRRHASPGKTRPQAKMRPK